MTLVHMLYDLMLPQYFYASCSGSIGLVGNQATQDLYPKAICHHKFVCVCVFC